MKFVYLKALWAKVQLWFYAYFGAVLLMAAMAAPHCAAAMAAPHCVLSQAMVHTNMEGVPVHIYSGSALKAIIAKVQPHTDEDLSKADRVEVYYQTGAAKALWVFSLKGCVLVALGSPGGAVEEVLGRAA